MSSLSFTKGQFLHYERTCEARASYHRRKGRLCRYDVNIKSNVNHQFTIWVVKKLKKKRKEENSPHSIKKTGNKTKKDFRYKRVLIIVDGIESDSHTLGRAEGEGQPKGQT